MKLSSLKLKNYRRFESFEMDFDPEMTVIAARNGQGKTTILEAIAAALGPFVGAFDMGKSEHISRNDARYSVVGDGYENEQNFPVIVEAVLEEPDIQWQRALNTPKGRTTTKEAAPLANYGKQLQNTLRHDGSVQLPVIAYYPSSRLWITHKDSSNKAILTGSRTMGYEDCLSSASSFRQLQKWFNVATRSIQQQKEVQSLDSSNLGHRVNGVQMAVNAMMKDEGWGKFHFSFIHEELAMTHPDHGELPVSMLSDGVRAMISLSADIAFRCARLNAHLGEKAPIETSGIIMIDELDLHLHPAWQQRVIKSLRSAFPAIQFIVSTHSPQVLSTVNSKNIRIIYRNVDDAWKSMAPSEEVKGIESAVALNDVMGVSPIPPVEEADWLANYIEMIDSQTHENAEGLELRQKLVALYGTMHPALLHTDRLIRFQKLKAQHRKSEKD